MSDEDDSVFELFEMKRPSNLKDGQIWKKGLLVLVGVRVLELLIYFGLGAGLTWFLIKVIGGV